ncbi:endonuclease/exonuclease/phosphatase family protein [Sphingomonas sp. SORGH_AS_0438]|uniref:endonuclease/exonuclease/phosphatase family protein n=1 Tax=Sphingomonas sp. SORGH_AS_0438 TaxID=3041756 RepID=UPI00285E58DA|nr:endonuclease/exonuclease/phosphatase family protein [Sphingomonas sp. SORGH_AS_0438]MDR6128045.1 endonuclease/exonuclease/phosphatase family metal-dependent hydrolase [Sphingomonas sp. SORGH_AS_0438]
MKVMTYNMQGSKGGNTWDLIERIMIEHDLDICMLQECGNPPISFKKNLNKNVLTLPSLKNKYGMLSRVICRKIQKGTGSRPGPEFYLVHAAWGVARNGRGTRNGSAGFVNSRCSLAVVSRVEPEKLVYVKNHLKDKQRPAIGMQINCDIGAGAQKVVFASVHAFAGGGNDGPSFIKQIKELAKEKKFAWVCGGDWNMEPSNWNAAKLNGSFLFEPDKPTHAGVSRYDYILSSVNNFHKGQVISNLADSDHFPVIY